MAPVVLKPLREVILAYARQLDTLTERRLQETLASVRQANGLLMLEGPMNRPAPSLMMYDCIVKSLIRLRLGDFTDEDGLRAMVRGKVMHAVYEDWFRRVNPSYEVYAEMMLDDGVLAGQPDIVYCMDGECGLIEIKATWRDLKDPSYLERVKRQLAAYQYLLTKAGFNIREAYIVTMTKVHPVATSELGKLTKPTVEYLRNLATMPWPNKPPNPDTCQKCILKPICPLYNTQSDKRPIQG